MRSFGAFADAFHAELAQRRRYLCPQPWVKGHGPANCPNWSTFAFRRRHLSKNSSPTALPGTPVIAAMLSGLVPRDPVLRCPPRCSCFQMHFTLHCTRRLVAMLVADTRMARI